MNNQQSNLIKSEDYLYEMLERIKLRPGMYLGKCSITRLRSFLDGYMGARADLEVPLTEEEKEFSQFQNWIQKRFNITSTQGWDSIILFYSADERDALNTFFELFEEFRDRIKADLKDATLLTSTKINN